MKKLILLFLALLAMQPGFSQRRMENLGRGVMASKVDGGVYVNWRITGQEWFGVSYNLYRGATKLNDTPITGASNYLDPSGTLSSQYQVAAVINGVEQAKSPAVSVLPNAYVELQLATIPKIAGVPDSYYNMYEINDITTADLDGDGEYELIVKRRNMGFNPSNIEENKYYTLIEAYKLDGTFMWRIDVGPNVYNDVEINVLAFDFDGDGKAEVVMRTSEGTVDGLGNVIPDLGNAQGDLSPDGRTNYRSAFKLNNSYYEYEGPEFLSLFDGTTGKELDRTPHIARHPVSQWGPSGTAASGLAHRALKFHYGAPYLDGKNPSVFVSRGIYHRTKMATFDIVDKKFVPRWTWDSGDGAYSGQGNHNYVIADVDNDGRDEIIYGSMTIDDNGTGLYTTGLGHGDAMHVSNFDPYRKGIEVFACLENSPYHGTTFRAAESGEILLQKISSGDEGRCMAANVSNLYKGAQMWPSQTGGFSASERKEISITGGTEFRIYWTGDLLSEILGHSFSSSLGKGVGAISKFNDGTKSWERLLNTDGYYSCNYTKGTPCLQADLFGDWREEVIFRSADDSKIRIYFTTYPTEHRIYTLMHDMQYRQAIAWQMCGYNQPPHTSFFLGELEGITLPPPPVMDNQRLVFKNSATTWDNSSANWIKDGVNSSFADGENVLFDVSGPTAQIALTSVVSPKSMYVNSTNDYSFNMTSGKLSGAMNLLKQGPATLTFNGNHDYSGRTEIWDGLVVFDGQLTNSPVWINLHGELAATGTLSKSVAMNYASVLYPGGKAGIGTLAIGEKLELAENSIIEFDMLTAPVQSDKISMATGTLSVAENSVFRINKVTGDLLAGNYVLIEVPNLTGDISKVKVEGLGSQIGTLSYADNKVVLTIQDVRSSGTIVWNGANDGSLWDVFGAENFSLNSNNTFFLTNDNVKFDDTSVSQSVNVAGVVLPANITVDASKDYTFQSDSDNKIAGTATLTKDGTGKLTIRGVNDFSGAVLLNEGTLAVESFPSLVNNGSIGIPSKDPNLFIIDNNAVLTSVGSDLKVSSRALHIGNGGAVINTNSSFRWLAAITGGTLTKRGSGNLAFFGANTFSKLIVESGSVTVGSGSSKAGNDVVLGNGTTYTHSTGNATNFELMDGASARINLASTATYSGRLTGNGTATINIPYVRENLTGNWSAFTGTLNFVTNFVHSSWSAELRISNTYGWENADMNVTGKIYVHHLNSSAVNFKIGGLSSNSEVQLALGNHTWTVGNRNTNTTFQGLMSGSGKLVKVGTGTLSLTNANSYTGTTTINGGRILALNTTGSATGAGAMTVSSGATIGGTGFIGNTVAVKSGGVIEPGDHTSTAWLKMIGTLTFNKGVSLQAGSKFNMSVRNRSPYPCDKVVVNGNAVIAGNLEVEIVNGNAEFPIGAKLTLFEFNGSVSGQFANMILPPTVVDSKWDTSKLLTDGTIEVVECIDCTGIISSEASSFNISPNPVTDFFTVDLPIEGYALVNIYDLGGNLILVKDIAAGDKVDVTTLSSGMYIVKVNVDGKDYTSKLVKK
ncbi:T9SS C-terminal target domain-containing protein [Dysgonomonas sp. 216]|uniref:rhamnogalacturonan lyase family protein n=1 Tax=Dysgonomonas sp. 216 TaxID=2302934 RepID=UPI0013D1B6DD|nr:autotransporter-associated beta strand repeat-containing protein [Dysgonomonas sp. 216]NDW19126.1 T9SS C-terminal target domain-containing protein [Dysgonomonas sp. 216]